jgi:hypothetical protein
MAMCRPWPRHLFIPLEPSRIMDDVGIKVHKLKGLKLKH